MLNVPADIVSVCAARVARKDVLATHTGKYLGIQSSENAVTACRNTQRRKCRGAAALLTFSGGSAPLWPFWYSMIECNTAEPGIVHEM